MTAIDPLAPFQWLNVSESKGGGPLNMIFSVAFFRGLDPVEVMRRFSHGEGSGQESGFDGLDEKVGEFLDETDGGDGGGHVGVFQVGEWCVAIEPYGWTATILEVATELSQGCEMLAVTRHDYAEDSFTYAINGTIITDYPLRRPYERSGSDPDRLNGFMRELGMGLDEPGDDAAWDAAWEDNHLTAVPRAFALAAKVTGVPFTPDMLGRPMLVGPIAER
ncbi:DUF6461 domain-containing protein [Planomonospora algeriensis]